MTQWTFKNKLNIDEKMEKIIQFYLFNTPVEGISARGRTFKEFGWNKKQLTPLLKKEIDFLSSNWIITTVKEIKTKLKTLGQLENVKFEEIAIHINNKHSNIDSFFYAVRCAIAHGSFSVRKHEKQVFYILENKHKGEIKARIVIKESTLLDIIKIISNPKKYSKKWRV